MSFKEIKLKYIETFVKKQKDLEVAFDEVNISKVHHLLHMLTGSSGGYGFMKLSELSRRGAELTRNTGGVNLQELSEVLQEIFKVLTAEAP